MIEFEDRTERKVRTRLPNYAVRVNDLHVGSLFDEGNGEGWKFQTMRADDLRTIADKLDELNEVKDGP